MTSNPSDVCLDPPVEEIWERALQQLKTMLPEPTFQSWIPKIILTAIAGNEASVAVANPFTKGMAPKYEKELRAVLTEMLGRNITLRIDVDPSLFQQSTYTPSIASITVMPSQQAPERRPPQRPAGQYDASQLANKHTFESFIVGSSNRFVQSAALAVAGKPGTAYNPLFIYGGVGLGKTHLIQAIGNRVLELSPHMVVRYVTSERFTNEMVNSIKTVTTAEFRKRYRQIDVLLIDDIQFIESKEATQEEFFHTFNVLREAGKQIVLTSDRPPRALEKLEERLKSRFEWGLIADIQPPDYEMRLAILQQKAERESMSISAEILEYIAGAFTNNIRELEGALVRANAYATLSGVPVTQESIMEILQPGTRRTKPTLTIDAVLDAVATYYRVEPSDLKSANRSHDLAVPRHVAMYLAHEELSLSLNRVGQTFGGRKHTSIKYACDKVKESLSSDADLSEAIRQIKRVLGC